MTLDSMCAQCALNEILLYSLQVLSVFILATYDRTVVNDA